MKTITLRELQHHASAVLRRVDNGETLAITRHGHTVAVLAPPSTVGGIAALEAAGRVRHADPTVPLPAGVTSSRSSEEILEESRAERS